MFMIYDLFQMYFDLYIRKIQSIFVELLLSSMAGDKRNLTKYKEITKNNLLRLLITDLF